MLVKLTFLCCCFSAIFLKISGAEPFWNDLRVQYSADPASGFHRVARTFGGAVSSEFVAARQSSCKFKSDHGYFYGFRVSNPKDEALSLLYDVNGVIAGVQAWYLHDEILISPQNHVHYYKVPMFQNATVDGKRYFVLTAYLVQPDTICSHGRNESALTIQGTGTGLFLQNGPTPADLLVVPKNRSKAIADGWTKNACFPGMGYHNFYKVAEQEATACLETQGALILYNKDGDMHGFGFHTQGLSQSKRWVEHPPNPIISRLLGDNFPQCILSQNDLIGSTTMHVYFIDKPWTINCP